MENPFIVCFDDGISRFGRLVISPLGLVSADEVNEGRK